LLPDIDPPDPDEGANVSNENNISGFAAISMLMVVLQNNTINAGGSEFGTAINDLKTLQTGLVSWFTNYALAPVNGTQARIFYQGGHVNNGAFNPAAINEYGGFAVDCQTWVSAVLGAQFIDNTIAGSVGTAYNIWQQTKEWAGYFMEDGSIGGVGYTKDPLHKIWTAEWTFGAILMTRNLAYDYNQMGQSQYATSLLADSNMMASNLQLSTKDGGMYDEENAAFLYCNHRYKIPWGWYANPIPALCSSAWGIMNAVQFDPFILGGSYPSTYLQQALGTQ